jgi:hypothetical protein
MGLRLFVAMTAITASVPILDIVLDASFTSEKLLGTILKADARRSIGARSIRLAMNRSVGRLADNPPQQLRGNGDEQRLCNR